MTNENNVVKFEKKEFTLEYPIPAGIERDDERDVFVLKLEGEEEGTDEKRYVSLRFDYVTEALGFLELAKLLIFTSMQRDIEHKEDKNDPSRA